MVIIINENIMRVRRKKDKKKETQKTNSSMIATNRVADYAIIMGSLFQTSPQRWQNT